MGHSQEDAGNGELSTTGISGRSLPIILVLFDGTKIIKELRGGARRVKLHPKDPNPTGRVTPLPLDSGYSSKSSV
jgi:hypothetical protein